MTVKAVILCGGQGMRIRDVAGDIPKPMVPIGGHPMLWHIMKMYAAAGIGDFVLCLGYKGWTIKEFFLNYRAFSADFTVSLGSQHHIEFHAKQQDDWRITLADTGEATQTGGRIARVRSYLDDGDLCCVTYGDGVADIDIRDLLKFHRRHGKTGTVTGVRPPGRFGVMSTEADGDFRTVREFREKPQTDAGWINGGFFVFDNRLWNYVTEDEQLVFEAEPLRRMAADGELVMYEHHGFWQPMDTFRDWKLLNELWENGTAPWKRD